MGELKFRIRNKGSESDLIESFLESNNLFHNPKQNYLILEETYAEIGIPDLLIIFWPKEKKIEWNLERNKLTKTDIKILHHISLYSSAGVNVLNIIEKLGFEYNFLLNALKKLEKAELIRRKGRKYFIYKFRQNFFLREIIAVEAKLSNTKKAISQALINQNFSSLSYILLPEKRTSNFENQMFPKIGFITYDGVKAEVKKKAERIELPGSYFSWILNEHIGRELYGQPT
jgi:predicted transcriptional regulator